MEAARTDLGNIGGSGVYTRRRAVRACANGVNESLRKGRESGDPVRGDARVGIFS